MRHLVTAMLRGLNRSDTDPQTSPRAGSQVRASGSLGREVIAGD